jgi:iron complex outermembrane recepter protein
MLALQAGAAMAQAAPDGVTNQSDVEEIVVTANRREQRLSDVGMSITALSAETLEQRNMTSVTDLGSFVPGLTVAETGTSIPIYSLRGIGTNEQTIGNASSVAIYVDEVPLTIPATTVGAALDIQRIEVLKGPQGTLYGQNSTGGAINYIANKPTNAFEAGVTGSYGRFNTASVEGYVSGPISPNLGFRVAARTIQGGDWQKNFARNDSIGETHKFAGRALLQWKPSSNFNLLLNFNGWVDKSDTIVPQTIAVIPQNPARVLARTLRTPLAPNNARAANWDAGRDFSRDDYFYQASARAEWTIADNVTLTSITAYGRYHLNASLELDGAGFDTVDQQNVTLVNTIQRSEAKTFSQEARLAAEFGGIQWLIGANYNHDNIPESKAQDLRDGSAAQNILGFKVLGALPQIEQRIRSWAVFGNVTIPLTDQIDLSAGVRFNEETRKFQGCTLDLNGGTLSAYNAFNNFLRTASGLPALTPDQLAGVGECASSNAQFIPALGFNELKEDNIPWNVNLNWKPANNMLFYARVSQGYKSGNFPALAGLNNSAYLPAVQESLRAYEIGTRISPSRMIRFEAAAFWYDYTNKQQGGRINVGPPLGTVTTTINIPKARIKGLEGSIMLRPLEGFTLSASGTYLDSEVRRYVGFNLNGVQLDQRGYALNYTPKYSANVDANYEFPVSDNLKAFLGANLAYRSKTISGIAASALYQIDAYTLLDAQAGVSSADGRWKVWAFGKNLTNKYYWTNVLRVSDVVFRYAGMPVTYGVSASFKY